jgi:hypothetical protein
MLNYCKEKVIVTQEDDFLGVQVIRELNGSFYPDAVWDEAFKTHARELAEKHYMRVFNRIPPLRESYLNSADVSDPLNQTRQVIFTNQIKE